MPEDSLIPVERIEKAIVVIRGQKVMLDKDLAGLYGKGPRKPFRRSVAEPTASFLSGGLFLQHRDHGRRVIFTSGSGPRRCRFVRAGHAAPGGSRSVACRGDRPAA